MAYFLADKYKTFYEEGRFGRPAMTADSPDKKYFLDWCNYVYSVYSYGGTVYGNGGVTRWNGRTISELRMYARGEQPVDKYRKLIDVQIDTVTGVNGLPIQKESIMNISWDIVKILPKFRDYALSKITEQDYEPVVRAADTILNVERRKKYLADRLAADDRMKQLFATAGYQPPNVSGYATGMAPGDVDMMNEVGAYALDIEILMQDVLGCSLDLSGYQELKPMLAKDMLDLNRVALQVYCLPGEKRIGVKYVDQAGLILPTSAYNDHRDSPYRAFIEHIPLSELRREMEGMSEKEIYLIAKKYAGYAPNATIRRGFENFADRGWREEYVNKNGKYPYDGFSLCVMNLYFTANQAESVVIGSDYGERMSDPPVNDVQYTYKCRWIVGTDVLLYADKDDTIAREGADGSKRALNPIIVYSGDGPSIIERCISYADDIQLATLKLRAMFANIPPGPRLSIDLSSLEETVRLGGQTFDMRKILSLYSGRGVLFYRSKSEFGDPNMPASNKRPINTEPSGAQEDFNLFSSVIASSLDMIRQLTGVSEYADGTGDLRRVGNAAAESAAESSNNALKPYIEEGFLFYRRMLNVMAKKYQMLALSGDIELRYWPVNADTVKILNISNDIAMYDLHVEARALPTQRDIEIMEGQILQFQQERKLNEADVMVLLGLLRERNIKKAALFMARAVSRNEDAQLQQQQVMQQQQAQGQIAMSQAAEQARANTIMMETEGKGRLQEAGHQQALELLKQKQKGDQELVVLQSQLQPQLNNSQ